MFFALCLLLIQRKEAIGFWPLLSFFFITLFSFFNWFTSFRSKVYIKKDLHFRNEISLETISSKNPLLNNKPFSFLCVLRCSNRKLWIGTIWNLPFRFTKAAGCGEAAHWRWRRKRQNKTIRFCPDAVPPSDESSPKAPDLPQLINLLTSR